MKFNFRNTLIIYILILPQKLGKLFVTCLTQMQQADQLNGNSLQLKLACKLEADWLISYNSSLTISIKEQIRGK